MTSTRRHKIARSAVIRRVKPRKSEKAKRPKAKTFRRKSRNNVMRGGVHKDLKVYVIQKNLGIPKCFIIREVTPFGLDTIYIFFDGELPDNELNTFLCAALNLNNLESIQPPLNTPKDSTGKFKSFFVKLSGIRSYTLSSGQLQDIPNFVPLSTVVVTKHNPDFKIGNGEAVIQRLKDKTTREPSFNDYTFTDKTPDKFQFNSFNFTLSNLNSLCDSIVDSTFTALEGFCNKSEIMGKVNELINLILRQKRLSEIADNCARKFSDGNGRVKKSEDDDKKSKDDDKNSYINEGKKRLPFTAEDVTKANNLIQEIKTSPDYQKCEGIIKQKHISLKFYLNDDEDYKLVFKTIEQLFDDAYKNI